MKPVSYILVAAAVLITPGLRAQSQDDESQEERVTTRWWSVGVRIRGYSSSVLADGKLERSISSPATSWTFTTTSSVPRVRVSPAADFALNKKLTLRLELLFQRPSYQQVAETYKGVDNPDTTTDERTKTTLTERTKVSLWDVPLMVRYQGIRDRGILSKMSVSGGLTLRTAAHIRSSAETVFSDSSTAYSEKPATPSRRNLIGGVVGVGFRFVDDYNIKVTPEIRYTYWKGVTFDSESTHSSSSQIEAGVALTF